jgi:hypothetical protein
VVTHLTLEDLGPGLHVMREVDPLKQAGPMATSLGADLCATLPQAEAALEERSTLPTVDPATLSALQVLARRIARAQRIAIRTRDRAVVEAEQRLAGVGSGVAVHPSTIRERAAAVETARRALAQAEAALASHDDELQALRAQADADAAAAQAAAEEAARPAAHLRQRTAAPQRRRARAISLVLAGFGLGLVLLAAGLPLYAALVPGLLACVVALRYLRPQPDDDLADREEASSLLSQMSQSTDELFGAKRAARELEERTALLDVQRDRAREDLRVAERAWSDLAGEGVDATDVEDVVRRFDPQHEDARMLAGETVGVRTAEVVLHQFQQRWLAMWADLGVEAPPADGAEEAVRELAQRVTRPVVMVGPATARATELARVAPSATIVVLDGATDDAAG